MNADRFEVTPEMIAKGVQQSRGDCAVAIALRMHDESIERVSVDRTTISFSNQSERLRYTYRAPAPVRTFIDKFDLNPTAVKPFGFVLDPSDAVTIKPMKRRKPAEIRDTTIKNPGTGVQRRRRELAI